MKILGYRQVLWIYRRVIEDTGGDFGIRDEGLLRSALARPQTSFGGQDLYPTLFEKAAALLESIVRNHPFIDGNKRVAWECLDLMLDLNGYRISADPHRASELMMKVIEHKVTVQEIADWVQQHSKPSKKG